VKHLICKLCYQQLHLIYLRNLARYWLQATRVWHDSVETCRSVIICEIIVHLLFIVQNNLYSRVQQNCWDTNPCLIKSEINREFTWRSMFLLELERNLRGRLPRNSVCRPLYGVQLQANARHRSEYCVVAVFAAIQLRAGAAFSWPFCVIRVELPWRMLPGVRYSTDLIALLRKREEQRVFINSHENQQPSLFCEIVVGSHFSPPFLLSCMQAIQWLRFIR
jgi:hypothetical protein